MPESPDPNRRHSQRVTGRAWEFEAYHPALLQILPAVKRFASDVLLHKELRVTPYWLTLLGPSGVGKTLILEQLYYFLEGRDYSWPIPTPKFEGDTSSRTPRCAHIVPGQDLTDWHAASEYGRYDLIYLEDLGATGGPVMQRAIELLQYRARKWTIIDANMSLEEMGRPDKCPRVASRLLRDGSQLIEIPMDVPDYNLR